VPETPDPAPEPVRRRRGALSFVVVFLAVTVVLLVLGRYAVNTRFMNWYLFEVAGHTSWILDVIGDSSELEDTSLYGDRPAAVRAELDSWRNGNGAAGQPEGEYSSEPLTAREVWQYRSMLLARQYSQTNEMAALTAPRSRPELESGEAQQAYLRERMNALTRSTRFDGPGGAIQVMPQGLGEFIQNTESTLAALERGEMPESIPLGAVLTQLEEQIESALDQQHAYLQSRAVQISLQIHDRHGPTVDFLARAGLTTQLRHAEAELNEVEQAAGLSEATRESRVRELKERIATLKATRETAAKNRDAEADKDLRFRFNVVPDCGALPSMSIFLAAMIAFPADLWRRLLGLLIGLPLLYAINIARLTCLALIGAYSENGQIFEFAHEYVWQAVYIIFVVIIWLMWVEFIVRPKSPQQTKAHPP
jgi:exosortase/archaeosortase family protein